MEINEQIVLHSGLISKSFNTTWKAHKFKPQNNPLSVFSVILENGNEK